MSLAFMCFLSPLASAQENSEGVGVFIEPAITYEVGKTSVNYPSPFSNSEGTADGLGLGAVIGLHYNDRFYFGVSGRFSEPKFKDSSVDYDSSAPSMNWGPVVGLQMADIGLRFWGTYIAAGTMDPERSGSLDVKFSDGTGYRIGTGLKLYIVSLNLEYQNINYEKSTLESIGPFNPGSTFSGVDLENESWIVSVSFPLEI